MAKAYVIVWQGKYLSKVGNSDHRGFWWVDTVSGARLYASEKELDKHLLQVARECSDRGPWPVVREFEVTLVRSIMHDERFVKNRERAKKVEATWQANCDKRRQVDARREVEELERRLLDAKERAGQ